MSQVVATRGHEEGGVKLNVAIFIALAVFTAVSFLVNSAEKADGLFGSAVLTSQTGFTLILGVAVVKALLVAAFFMHLRFDFRRIYVVVLPALILATALIVGLWPDMVLAWH